ARAAGLPARLPLRPDGAWARPRVLGEARASLRGVTRGRRARLGRRRRQPLTEPLEDVAAAVLLEVDVHRADAVEDLVRDLLLLLAARLGPAGEGPRLPKLDRHLREAKPSPATDLRRAMDRDW